jgi:hypothetical protein
MKYLMLCWWIDALKSSLAFSDVNTVFVTYILQSLDLSPLTGAIFCFFYHCVLIVFYVFMLLRLLKYGGQHKYQTVS